MQTDPSDYTTIHVRRDLKQKLKELGEINKRSAQRQLEYVLEIIFEDEHYLNIEKVRYENYGQSSNDK